MGSHGHGSVTVTVMDAYDRARAARLNVYRLPASHNFDMWQARWKWRNEWVKAMAADKAAADPRLTEIWKGEPPHGKT